MPEPLMDQARRALREERTEDAQAILVNVIVREPESEEAWLLLAEVLSDATKKRECLERARSINPRNPAILRALEQLNSQPAPTQPAVQPLSRVSMWSVPPEVWTESVEDLFQRSEQIAQSLLLTVESGETQRVGVELLGLLDAAVIRDPVGTRRWTRTAGRAALFKYEKSLTASIANMPRDDLRLRELRELRQRALDYLR